MARIIASFLFLGQTFGAVNHGVPKKLLTSTISLCCFWWGADSLLRIADRGANAQKIPILILI
jgi:hypothetical protein